VQATTVKTWQFQLHSEIQAPRFQLRDYQGEAIARAFAYQRSGQKRVFICAPTASGKGTMIGAAVNILIHQRQKVVIMLNMSSLVVQTIEDLIDFGLAGNISVISGGHPACWTDLSKPVQVVMLQSAIARPETLEYLRGADFVFFDEFHTSKNYEAALDFVGGGKPMLAFSATPYNDSLADVCDEAVVCPSYSQLQRLGYLAPLRYNTLSLPLDGKPRDLVSEEGCRHVIRQYLESDGVKAEGKGRSFWFTEANRRGESESHAQRLVRVAGKFGLKLAIVNDDISQQEKSDLLQAVAVGDRIHGLVSVDALAVGVDVRALRHVCILRQIGSRDRYVQIVGRVCRSSPESNKTTGYVYDWAGNTKTATAEGLHPMIEVLSEALTPEFVLREKKEAGEGDAPYKKCKHCDALNHAAAIKCRECDQPFPVAARATIDDGELVSDWFNFDEFAPVASHANAKNDDWF
jgi:superfamily II DNA or RNA helicase